MARTVLTPGWEEELTGAILHSVVAPITREVYEDARASAPRDTGDMAAALDHWEGIEGSDAVGRVGVRGNPELATRVIFNEYGTARHEIRPRRAEALHWPGADHAVAKVDHPGTRPNPFMRRALYSRRSL